MKVKVLYFSSIKDKIGKKEEELELKEQTTVSKLIDILKEKYPHISEYISRVMIAVNEDYVEENYLLKDGDVVAIIPPVSGG